MGRDERSNPFGGPRGLVDQVIDALGRPLQEDDKIILNTTRPIHLRIAQIVPALDPSLPPGAVHLHLGVLLTLTVKKGTPVLEVIRIATAAESEPNPVRMVDATQVAATDPGGVQ